VKDGSDQYPLIVDTPFFSQNMGQGNRMIDVGGGSGILAPLVAVLVGGKSDRGNDEAHAGQCNGS
jgi:ubiquinone/menaquinone biosynthesis C-methylase UbiE